MTSVIDLVGVLGLSIVPGIVGGVFLRWHDLGRLPARWADAVWMLGAGAGVIWLASWLGDMP